MKSEDEAPAKEESPVYDEASVRGDIPPKKRPRIGTQLRKMPQIRRNPN